MTSLWSPYPTTSRHKDLGVEVQYYGATCFLLRTLYKGVVYRPLSKWCVSSSTLRVLISGDLRLISVRVKLKENEPRVSTGMKKTGVGCVPFILCLFQPDLSSSLVLTITTFTQLILCLKCFYLLGHLYADRAKDPTTFTGTPTSRDFPVDVTKESFRKRLSGKATF